MDKRPTVEEVRQFAITAHGDQTYGVGVPYSVHLDAVVAIIKDNELAYSPGNPGPLYQLGYLHDVVEDTPITLKDLQDFGIPEVLRDAVDFCTDEPGHNRKTRKTLTYRKWRETILWEGLKTGWVNMAIWVKLADRLANLRESKANNPGLLKMYRKEAQAFRAALIEPAQPWIPEAMWKEYDELVGLR